jgi:outer membrane lipoprotein carrier protein
MPASPKLCFLACTGLTVLATTTLAQNDEAAEPTTNGADLLRRFLDDTQTYRADFDQVLLAPDGEEVERATGELSIARPGRFVWRYFEPLDQLVVADGTNLWIYDAELSQATVTPLAEAARATPAMLLSGDATLDEEFVIRESFELERLQWVRLEPQPAGADFKEILIGFDGATLRRLQLLDSLDQTTSLEFSRVEVNTEIASSVFDFVPPEGVDVIGEAR